MRARGDVSEITALRSETLAEELVIRGVSPHLLISFT